MLLSNIPFGISALSVRVHTAYWDGPRLTVLCLVQHNLASRVLLRSSSERSRALPSERYPQSEAEHHHQSATIRALPSPSERYPQSNPNPQSSTLKGSSANQAEAVHRAWSDSKWSRRQMEQFRDGKRRRMSSGREYEEKERERKHMVKQEEGGTTLQDRLTHCSCQQPCSSVQAIWFKLCGE